MENKKDILLIILSLIIIFLSVKVFETNDDNLAPTAHVCEEDSLKSLVNELLMQKELDENGWDDKEKRYEQVIFEFQYGLDHLKNYHQQAYRDFHRILSHKEYYSHEDERENKKRLQIEKW
jgi:hypothetical protein